MSCRRPSAWTQERLRKAARARAQRHEILRAREVQDCDACQAGVHDPEYTDDGVAICACCGRDMTGDGFPRLELT